MHEALKGFSNIPITIIAFAVGILAAKFEKTKDWAALFFFIGIGSICGMIVHTFAVPHLVFNILWTALFFLLLEICSRFTHCFSIYVCREDRFNAKLFRILLIVFLVAALVTLWIFDRKEMLFVVAYGAICLVFLARCFIQVRKAPKKVIVLVSLLPLILIMQAFNEHIPYAVVIEHIIIAAMLLVMYSMSKDERE